MSTKKRKHMDEQPLSSQVGHKLMNDAPLVKEHMHGGRASSQILSGKIAAWTSHQHSAVWPASRTCIARFARATWPRCFNTSTSPMALWRAEGTKSTHNDRCKRCQAMTLKPGFTRSGCVTGRKFDKLPREDICKQPACRGRLRHIEGMNHLCWIGQHQAVDAWCIGHASMCFSPPMRNIFQKIWSVSRMSR